MKYVKQFGIILTISFIGELCNQMIPLPVPASIYGLVILFIGLLLGWVKLDSVKETGKFLIEIMPLMFIPAAVGLLESWGVLRPIFVPVITITLLTTILVMAVAGRVTQLVIRVEGRTGGRTAREGGKESRTDGRTGRTGEKTDMGNVMVNGTDGENGGCK